ncbi:hypothetical protein SCLARK_001675 [Spiroplasma clarkii]|uniref:Lipoprotein n=1 Tax=Spiroplasma clarkii TaxID=2139 RepID=A0A1Y0L2A4_9MOLU|nr:hypothetical protein [Spiroplasma clarkii]ARU92141.1 hypothetical protein SCLARK_001675 [Spiroplasma clarkii]ATX71474.1 hypothetical protein SCLAR_v1c11740 [Spiroplasma clarkii]
MKKLLSLLGTATLVSTSASAVACCSPSVGTPDEGNNNTDNGSIDNGNTDGGDETPALNNPITIDVASISNEITLEAKQTKYGDVKDDVVQWINKKIDDANAKNDTKLEKVTENDIDFVVTRAWGSKAGVLEHVDDKTILLSSDTIAFTVNKASDLFKSLKGSLTIEKQDLSKSPFSPHKDENVDSFVTRIKGEYIKIFGTDVKEIDFYKEMNFIYHPADGSPEITVLDDDQALVLFFDDGWTIGDATDVKYLLFTGYKEFKPE